MLGQPDFTSRVLYTTQNGLNSPDDMAYDSDNERLFVSDEDNNRVMVFSVPANATSSINGENAILVLGQADFTHNTVAVTQNGMSAPVGLGYDPVNFRLFVAEYDNNRVMVFSVPANATSSINGEPALNVLGQADLFHNAATTTQNGLHSPDDIDYDSVNGRLFVSDLGNNRIMIWNVASTITDNQNAQNNIGQSDWTSSTSGLSQNKFSRAESPHSYDVLNNRLFSYSGSDNRVLEFSFIKISTASLPNGTAGTSYSQAITAASTQGTLSFSLSSGSLPPGLSLDTSTGVISGIPTSAATATFSIEADDNFSTGPFFDRATYTLGITANTPNAPTSESSPLGCNESGSTGVPDLFEIRTNKNTATLYFLPPTPPYSSFYIAYSRKPNVLEYGVEYNQNYSGIGGVLKYTIGMLQPNTKYYFKIRAGNGCATGNWGNTMTAITTYATTQRTYYKNFPVVINNLLPRKENTNSPVASPNPSSTPKPNVEIPTPIQTTLPSQTQPAPKPKFCILWWCF